MKSSRKYLLPALAVACLATASTVSAATFNDDFENGLIGWNVAGDGAIRSVGGSNAVVLTNAYASGIDDATNLNLSGTNPLSAGGPLESAAGLATGALDLDALNQASEGSALWRTFAVTAGEALSFDWKLQTNDTAFADYAFLVVDGTLIKLGSTADATQPGVDPDYAFETGMAHYEHIFATSGTVRVAFGVTDMTDYTVSSALALDNVSVSAIPEPATALFGLAALGCMALSRRRLGVQPAA